MRRWLLLALGVSACPGTVRPPGDEAMGSYAFHAEWIPTDPACVLRDVSSSPIDFTGSFSRFRDGGGVFLTLNDVPRDAGFDGQIVTSTHSAPRTFSLADGGTCGGCQMRLYESLTVALLSKSQSAALGDKCPPNPLDGGIPGPDAGVSLPGSTSTGFDAVRACGILQEHIVGTGSCDPDCNSPSCQLDYVLTGARQ